MKNPDRKMIWFYDHIRLSEKVSTQKLLSALPVPRGNLLSVSYDFPTTTTMSTYSDFSTPVSTFCRHSTRFQLSFNVEESKSIGLATNLANAKKSQTSEGKQ